MTAPRFAFSPRWRELASGLTLPDRLVRDLEQRDRQLEDQLVGVGPGVPTFLVAASNATDRSKRAADPYVCDGSGDEEVINQAFADRGSARARVVLSEGTFTVADKIAVPQDCQLAGLGQRVSRVELVAGYAGATPVVDLGFDAEVCHLAVLGNGVAGAIDLIGGDDGSVVVRDCLAYDAPRHGVHLTAPGAAQVLDVAVVLAGGAALRAVAATDAFGLVVRGCAFDDNAGRGIELVGSGAVLNNCTIIDNKLFGCDGHGVYLENAGSTVVANNQIGHDAGANHDGVHIVSSARVNVSDNVFSFTAGATQWRYCINFTSAAATRGLYGGNVAGGSYSTGFVNDAGAPANTAQSNAT